MTKVTAGNTVRMHYTGSLSNGTTFDTSEGREPLGLRLGLRGHREVVEGDAGPPGDRLVRRTDLRPQPLDLECGCSCLV